MALIVLLYQFSIHPSIHLKSHLYSVRNQTQYLSPLYFMAEFCRLSLNSVRGERTVTPPPTV